MTDDRLEQIVGNLLRVGVALSATVVLAGGIWLLASGGFSHPAFHDFHPDVHGVRSLAALPGPEAVILVGLLLLIATPVARVVLTLAVFALRRDKTYTVITVIVLVVLLYSIGTSWL